MAPEPANAEVFEMNSARAPIMSLRIHFAPFGFEYRTEQEAACPLLRLALVCSLLGISAFSVSKILSCHSCSAQIGSYCPTARYSKGRASVPRAH
ncbi:hypothetical protein ABIC09_005902 [Bradyrhizobium sp. S3.12.5]